MQVSCLQENLAKGLLVVGRAISSRSTLPILGNILLEAKDNQLRLAATNLEIGINCWIGAKVEDEGAITVPARLLSEFVKNLPPEVVEMALTVRTQTLNLHCSHHEAKFKGIDAIEFPILPTIDLKDGVSFGPELSEGTLIDIETDSLRSMIEQVAFAASTDESRPLLTGVEVVFERNLLKMSATDGHRLSLKRVSVERDSGNEGQIIAIVPARGLRELARMSTESHPERPVRVQVTHSRNQILFQVMGKGASARGSFHRAELISQLIDARYPDLNSMIPHSYYTRAVVDRASMLKAVRLASLFARDSSNMIRVGVLPGNSQYSGQMRLTATSTQAGDNINEIEAKVDGSELEIIFDSRYLVDVLSRINESQVVLEITEPTRPGTIRPISVGKDESLHIVLPMVPPR